MLSIKLSSWSWGRVRHSTGNALRSSGIHAGGGCNSLAEHDPHMLHRIHISRERWSFQTIDILKLKALAYDVCTVRTGVVMQKLKFCAHGTPEQAHILFRNDVTIHLTYHGSDSNTQICSVTQNNSTPNVTMFNDVVLVVTGP